jgi:hypothetical protein
MFPECPRLVIPARDARKVERPDTGKQIGLSPQSSIMKEDRFNGWISGW